MWPTFSSDISQLFIFLYKKFYVLCINYFKIIIFFFKFLKLLLLHFYHVIEKILIFLCLLIVFILMLLSLLLFEIMWRSNSQHLEFSIFLFSFSSRDFTIIILKFHKNWRLFTIMDSCHKIPDFLTYHRLILKDQHINYPKNSYLLSHIKSIIKNFNILLYKILTQDY